ncbi:MAG: right-handed parallel beta-helix repeat-containing protein [Pyrinomonadaceae bacterium]|nr:right-handed parallel beta-helix repeat-containing protein [Pyrinomonadaceae bacterium]
MKYKNMAKIFIIFCIAPLVIVVGFSLNWSALDNPSPAKSVQSNPTGTVYSKKNRTREELLLEMRENGWLKADFSEWFVSPNGRPTGTGTLKLPLDLETVLGRRNGSSAIKPGDIVWLRGGKYRGSYTVQIGGISGRPVHIRQYPGERAILDKSSASREVGTLTVRGPHVWFWDFEISNTYPVRSRLDRRGKLKPWRGSGINVFAAYTKYINLIIRDNGHGIGIWNENGATEIYGCLIFNNGNNKKEHGIYAHNKSGIQRIENNIIFNNSGYGLHIYANSPKRSISGFEIENNTVFENGSLMKDDQAADQILVGGVEGVAAGRVRLQGNVVYTDPESKSRKSRGIRLGYRHQSNADLTLLDNFVVGRVPLKILWWDSVEACGNTVISSGRGIEIKTPASPDYSKYRFYMNRFWSHGNTDRYFVLDGKKTAFSYWYSKISKSSCSRKFQNNKVADKFPRIFINRNKYDETRANLTVYGGGKFDYVLIELGDFLVPGERFGVWDAENYTGEQVFSGVFEGKPIRLSLRRKKTAQPVGDVERVPAHTGPDFSVFVVRKL